MLHPSFHLRRYRKIRVEFSFVRIGLLTNGWRILSGLSTMRTILRKQKQISWT